MKKVYFTITGTGYYSGDRFFESGMKVNLEKDRDNSYDSEAIKVTLEGLGTVGYVANSTHTVLGESYSAGRLYDKIGDTAEGTVIYVTDRGIIGYVELQADNVLESAVRTAIEAM